MNYNLLQNGKDITRIDVSFGNIKTLPILPLRLEKLCADNNFALEELPEFPSSLRILSICLTGVKELGRLPETLEELYVSENPEIYIETLPRNLRVFVANSCELEILPPLPKTLTTLSVDANYLEFLPDLPDTVEVLIASNNYLIQLSRFPTVLRVALLNNNRLKRLPPLPQTLIELNCAENLLQRLPMLPESLFDFIYFGNPLIYEFHNKSVHPKEYINRTNRFVEMVSFSIIKNSLHSFIKSRIQPPTPTDQLPFLLQYSKPLQQISPASSFVSSFSSTFSASSCSSLTDLYEPWYGPVDHITEEDYLFI